ncbi:MAG: 2-amino-4-hydroxy-6-hydroxymethyldihydropteridine diphosphokinase [Parvibaculum sp.]
MILIALGGNLATVYGTSLSTLKAALAQMPDYGIGVSQCSSFYQTQAVAPDAQPPYVNAVAVVETAMPAVELLATLHQLEARFGRVRRARWAARTLDLDLLDYEGEIIIDQGPRGVDAGAGPLPLALPHPGMPMRGFVLVPLAEVAPEWRHPVTGDSASGLLQRLKAVEGEAALAGITLIQG